MGALNDSWINHSLKISHTKQQRQNDPNNWFPSVEHAHEYPTYWQQELGARDTGGWLRRDKQRWTQLNREYKITITKERTVAKKPISQIKNDKPLPS